MLEKIWEKLGSIASRLDGIERNLRTHMRRTENLEERVKPIEYHVKFHARVSTFFYALATATLTALIVRYFLA